MAELSNIELLEEINSLKAALSVAKNRLDAVEDWQSRHLGIDWGRSTVNTPHPNISANTIESGGGIIRQDANGMQIDAIDGTTTAIYFLDGLSSAPGDSLPQGKLDGTVFTTGEANLRIDCESANGGIARVMASASDTQSFVEIQAFDQNLAGPKIELSSGSDGSQIFIYGALYLRNILSPSQITSNQNDYNPTGFSRAQVLRLNSDASRDITGISQNWIERFLLIVNVGSFDIVLKDESASSTAENRFALNGDLTLQSDNSVILWYDTTSSRWRAI